MATLIKGSNLDPAINITTSGNIVLSGTVASTSTTTGVLTVAGGVGIVGALNVGGNTSITGAITSVDSIQLDTALAYVAPGNGKIVWNEEESSLEVGLGNDVVASIPEVTLYHVTNNTGSTIPKGTLVASVGTLGNSGKILIAPYLGSSHQAVQIMGITTESIPTGLNGHVTHFGKVRGIQTNGANYGEVWSNGDIVYARAEGGLTKTVPVAPNTKTIIAIVISAHGSNGTLFVRPTLSSSIANDDLVQLTSIANGDMLVYNSTAGRFENSKTLPGTLTLSGGTANGVLFLNGSKAVTSGTALTFDGTLATITGTSAGATLQLLKLNNAGAGGNTKSQIGFFAASTQYAQISGGYGASSPEMNFLLSAAGTGAFTWETSSSTEAMRLNASGLEVKGKLAVGYSSFTNIPANGAAFSGNVGIGTNAPLARLSVGAGSVTDANVPIQISTQANTGFVYFGANKNGTQGAFFGYDNTSFAGLTLRNVVGLGNSGDGMSFVVNNSTEAIRIRSNGFVGISQTNALARLQVEELGIDTTTTPLIGPSGNIALFPVTAFRTAEFMVQITDHTNNQYHSAKIFLMHNDIDVWFNVTNVLHSHNELGTFDVTIFSGNVRLNFNAVAATTKTIKVGVIKLAV